jgi:hypothetical protein
LKSDRIIPKVCSATAFPFGTAINVIFLISHSRNQYFQGRPTRAINCKLAFIQKYFDFETTRITIPWYDCILPRFLLSKK